MDSSFSMGPAGFASNPHALAARSLVPLLRENASRADAERRLPDENLAALRNAGLLRLAVPRAYGGQGLGLRDLLPVLSQLGRGCSSTAWVTAIYYGGGLAAGLFNDAVRQRIWGENPDARVCGVIGNSVPVTRTDGGLRLDGRWAWASGVHHADWVGLDVTVNAEDSAPERGIALVPVSELSIQDTWHMVGMRGTGSDTVSAEGVVVPEEYVLWFKNLAAGSYRREGPDERLTRAPLPSGFMLPFIGPVLGMGQSVLEQIVGLLQAGRPMISGSGLHALAIDTPGVQSNVADAAMLIDSAVLQADRAAGDFDRAAGTGIELTPVVASRLRMDLSFAARQIRHAVDLLLDAGGASRFDEASPLARSWRDLGFVSRHPAFGYEVNREIFGQLLLDRRSSS